MSDTYKILLLDDDELFLRVYSDYLSRNGFFVATHKNAKDALQSLSSGEHFDAAVVDIMLIDMNGWEFLQEVRVRLNKSIVELPVVVISAFRSTEVEFEAFKHLANAVIIKDGSAAEKLVDQLNRFVGKREPQWIPHP